MAHSLTQAAADRAAKALVESLDSGRWEEYYAKAHEKISYDLARRIAQVKEAA